MAALPSSIPHIVAMPYPGRGHINPMLILARLLASRGLLVTFVVTEEWLSFLTPPSPPLPPTLRLRSIPNVIPSEHGRANDFIGFLEAVNTKMEAPFERLVGELDPPVTAVLADTYLSWAVAVAGRRGVPLCSLFTMSATFFAGLYYFERLAAGGDGVVPAERSGKALEHHAIGLTSEHLNDMQSLASVAPSWKRAMESIYWAGKANCVLFSSFYEVESRVIDALRAVFACPVYPVGPSIPYMMLHENRHKNLQSDCNNSDYFDWLASQPKKSVLYVSLGSFLSVSGSQMVEIAMGLRGSGTRFLWVAREKSLEMQEMSGGKGFVVPWCNQLEVLNHPSVGGFLTHCGWNSTLEGVYSGVPMLTLPIFWDQPIDSRLIVDEWRVGLSLKEEAKSKDFVRRDDIASVLTRFMDLESAESKEIRRRSMELRVASLKAIKEGGSSFDNLDSFVRFLCKDMIVSFEGVTIVKGLSFPKGTCTWLKKLQFVEKCGYRVLHVKLCPLPKGATTTPYYLKDVNIPINRWHVWCIVKTLSKAFEKLL